MESVLLVMSVMLILRQQPHTFRFADDASRTAAYYGGRKPRLSNATSRLNLNVTRAGKWCNRKAAREGEGTLLEFEISTWSCAKLFPEH